MLIQSIMHPDFTTMDLIDAQQTLSMPLGVWIECVAAEAGPVMTDEGVALLADKSFKTASRSPDIILMPGGRASSVNVLKDRETVDFVARQGANASVLELVIEYNPQPPFSTGHSSIADADTLARARPIIEAGVSDTRLRTLATGIEPSPPNGRVLGGY